VTAIELQIDTAAEAAYVLLSEAEVRRTEQMTDEVLVDLDEYGMVTGIEVLRLAAVIPFGRLVSEYHVHTDVIELLRRIQPSVSGFVMLTQGSEGTASVVAAQPLAAT
jgi:uncharacterized protein YuzE